MLDLEMDRTLNDLLQIALGEFKHHIYAVEVLVVFRFNDINDPDDIGMLQLAQEIDFSQNALAIDLIFEDSIHALYRDLFTCWLVSGAAHSTVGALSQYFDTFVVSSNFPVGKLTHS